MNAPVGSVTLPYRERVFHAIDDVPIYLRDYGDPSSKRVPVLFLGGLTRNAKDAHLSAMHLSKERRVLAMDYRGRGRSGYDPDWRNYHPRVYVADVTQMLAMLDVHRVVIVGTSLGGICAMGMGAAAPTSLAGVVLNDIGPKIDDAGRVRIASYVGVDLRLPTVDAAADHLSRQFAHAYPDWDRELWLAMAEATFTSDPVARNLRLDYDLRIGDALKAQAGEPPTDLWPLYRSLRDIPVLAVRGDLSDILDSQTFDQMAEAKPDLIRLTVPRTGHVPLPHREPFATVLDEFLRRF
ncbi:MAG TPA: alpha/beta hydrolase [Candidatus Cybelea sp.]|nr:alpha/beta hydrolase [Candidatus Cybelea sp.]